MKILRYLVMYDTGQELTVELKDDYINGQPAIHAFVSYIAIASARSLVTVDGTLAVAWARVLYVLPLDKEQPIT